MNACKTKRSFTLIEIMIVILIIGTLASIAVPSYSKARSIIFDRKARHDLAIIASAVDKLGWDTGMWPGGPRSMSGTAVWSIESRARSYTGDRPECWKLTSSNAGICTSDGTFKNWKGPYLGVEAIPLDPWRMPYIFDADYYMSGRTYVVVHSGGPNKSSYNVYDSDNIVDIIEIR